MIESWGGIEWIELKAIEQIKFDKILRIKIFFCIQINSFLSRRENLSRVIYIQIKFEIGFSIMHTHPALLGKIC